MGFLKRYVSALVSLLGSIGLGLTLTYFVGVYLAVQEIWKAWTAFFTYWGPRLVFVPASLLLLHLYLRMKLGEWLVDEGRIEEAIDYTSPRLERNFMRSRREALHHRLALVRALVRDGRYDRAAERLWSGYAMPDSGKMAARLRRWQAEVGLRREDADAVRDAYRQGEMLSGYATPLARLSAARAELAIREESKSEFVEYAESADWLDEGDPRVDASWVLGAAAFERDDDEELTWALERLEEVRAPVTAEVPGRAAELHTVRAELLALLGRSEEAFDALETAREVRGDDYAEQVVARVEERLEKNESESL